MISILIRHDKVTDELGNTVEIKLWKVLPSPDKPRGYKYSLVYIALPQLANDFLADVEQFKRNLP